MATRILPQSLSRRKPSRFRDRTWIFYGECNSGRKLFSVRSKRLAGAIYWAFSPILSIDTYCPGTGFIG